MIPRFWWDFAYDPNRVIVESNDPKVPVVATFNSHNQQAIAAAEKLIKDCQEGRYNYRK